MKNIARFVTMAAILDSTLILSGCSSRMAKRPQLKVVEEFSIVESSTSQELTPDQIVDLRKAVISYLQEQGLTNNRIYYARVTFPAANPDEEPQWAVVRIGNFPAQTFTVLAAYPGPDDCYPYDYYRMGYHGGYSGFTRWGYYDPFDYNYGHYSGRARYPRDDHKPGIPTRWNPPRNNHPPRDRAGGQWGRGHDPGGHSPGNTGRGRPPSPPPDRTYTPPPERAYSPPAPERVESSNAGIQQAAGIEKEK